MKLRVGDECAYRGNRTYDRTSSAGGGAAALGVFAAAPSSAELAVAHRVADTQVTLSLLLPCSNATFAVALVWVWSA